MDGESAGIRAHFALRYSSDRDAGRVRSATEYLALYPGFEEVVRDQLARFAALQASPDAVDRDSDAAAWTFGEYRIERELGRGGQGTVYLAVDRHLDRRVALKVLDRGATGSDDALLRFRREAEILGRLDHPAIAAVFDAGMADGRPYIAMRYVPGKTLAQSIIEDRAPGAPRRDWRARSRLVLAVTRAVDHAHAAGVIHRDLKPQNIMVTPSGEPVILDFGLARALDPAVSGLTMTGDVLGTPAYMAPERISGDGSRIDARCDVYALGVVLYECLTLERPFGGATREDLYRAILSGDASDLIRRQTDLPRDLAIVVDKAMERDVHRRYVSAKEFADDLGRVLDGAPIRARRPGAWRRFSYWRRKHPAIAAAALVAIASAVGLAVSQQRALERERADKRQLESKNATIAEALARAVGNRLSLQSVAVTPDDPVLGLLLGVEAAKRSPGGAANGALWRALSGKQETRVFYGHDGPVVWAGFSPDGRRILTIDATRLLILHDAASGKEVARLDALAPALVNPVFVPDDDAVFFGSSDGRLFLWRYAGESAPRDWLSGAGPVLQVCVSRDGATLFARCARTIAAWRAADGVETGRYEARGIFATALVTATGIRAVEHANGRASIVGLGDGFRVPLAMPAGLEPFEWIEFLGDDRRLTSFHPPADVVLWNARDGALIKRFEPLGDRYAMAYAAANGRYIVGGGTTHGVYDVESGEFLTAPNAEPAVPFHFGVPSPDGELLATWTTTGRRCELWETRSGKRRAPLLSHTYNLNGVVWSPDAKRLITFGRDATARLWDVESPLERRGLVRAAVMRAFDVASISPDGASAIVRYRDDGRLAVLDLESGATRVTIAEPVSVSARAEFDDGGETVIVAEPSFGLGVFDPRTGARLRRFVPVLGEVGVRDWTPRAGLAPDGRSRIVEAGGAVFIQAEGAAPRSIPLPTIHAKAWSPDGRMIATGEGEKHTVRLIDVATGATRRTFLGHTGHVMTVVFSHDGRLIVTAAVDTSVRVWDADSGRLLVTILGLPMGENLAGISPDDRFIVVRTETGDLHFFVTSTGAPHGVVSAVSGGWGKGVFTADARRFVTTDAVGLVRFWPLDPLAWATDHLPRALDGRESTVHSIGTESEQRSYSDRWTLEHGNQLQRLALTLRRIESDDLAAADAIVRESLRRRPKSPVASFGLACVRAKQGDHAGALDALASALRFGWGDMERVRYEPALASLRGEERFSELLRRGLGSR